MPCRGNVLDVSMAIVSFNKSGVQQGSPKWVFGFLEVPLQGFFGALPEAFIQGFLQYSV